MWGFRGQGDDVGRSREIRDEVYYGFDMTCDALFRFVSQQVDDVVDAIPVHFACGAWGVFAASLFATKDNCECFFDGKWIGYKFKMIGYWYCIS